MVTKTYLSSNLCDSSDSNYSSDSSDSSDRSERKKICTKQAFYFLQKKTFSL